MANKLITITDEERKQLKKANAKYKSGLTLEPVGGVRALARIPEQEVNNNIGDAIAYGAESGWEGVKSGLNSAQLGARYLAADKMGMDNTADKLENELRLAEQNALKNQQEIASKYNTNFGGVANTVQGVTNATVSTIPAVVLGALAAAATKNPVVGVNAARVIRGVPLAETMVQAGGNAINQAIGDGATTDEALQFGGAKAVAEGIPEYLFKGIKYMPGTIDIGEKLAGKVANETVKKATRFAGNMAGEGIEEGIVEIADPFLKNATYSEGEKIDWDAVRESAILGALTGGVMNAGITGIEKGVNALPNVQKVQQKDQNRAFEALHGQKMEQKNADASQNAENALGQEIVDTAIKNTLNGNKASQNQSSQADFVKNAIENVMNQKPVQNAPKMDATISETETVGAKNAQASYETKPTDEKSSNVGYEDYDLSQLSEEVHDFYEQIGELGEKASFKVRIVKNLDNNANGMYDGHGNILISADAAGNIESIRKVASHEIYHHMKNTDEHKHLQDLAFELAKLEAPNLTPEQLVQNKIDDYFRLSEGKVQLDNEAAWDEVGAELVDRMLTDKKLAEQIWTEMPSLAERIVRALNDMLQRFKNRKLSPMQRQEAELLRQARDTYIEGLRSMKYANKPSETGERYSVGNQDGLFAPATVQSDSQEVRYSINSLRHDITEGKMRDDLISKGGMGVQEADAFIANLSDLADHIESFQSTFLDMFEPYGKEGRATLPYKDNSDPLYKVSLDFSTLCKKRIITQAMIERLQVSHGRALSAEEQIAIRDYLKELKKTNDKIEVACAMCYVEAARLRTPKAINKFLANPAEIVQKYLGTKNAANKQAIKDAGNAKLKEFGYEENTSLKVVKANNKEHYHAVKGARDAVKNSYKSTDPEEIAILDFLKNEFEPRMVLTASGLMELKQKQPKVYTAFNAFVAGQAKAKALQTGEPYYYGDASAVGDELIAQMNAENGMRHNSWSDFEVIHLLDLLVATTELAVRGAKMHYYSKVPAEFYVMKDTEAMGNISLIAAGKTGFNEKGELDFDPVEGVPFEEAMKIRKECSRTAGTVCIGINDAHIKALLESDVIDYVIPYHTSGLNKMLRKMVGVEGWEDYQNYQNEKDSSGKNAANGLKFSDWFHPTEQDIATKSGIEIMREAQQEYLRLCKERGITPKFSNTKEGTDFSKHENYWKLLIDRKMIDNEGNIIIQQKVQPKFDFDYMKELVNKEHENSPQKSIDEAINAVEGLSTEELNARAEQLKSGKRYSLPNKDTAGRELSKEQAEYFKNSKVRDENGRLQVAYHSTDSFGFNVFDKEKSDGMFFFTKNKDMAQTYAQDSGTYEVFLNIENPLIVDAKDSQWNNIRLSYSEDDIMSAVEQYVELAQKYDTAIDKQLILYDSWGDVRSGAEYIIEESGDLFTPEQQEKLLSLAEQIDNAPDDWGADEVDDNDTMSTREIAQKAKEMGHDGVIIKNVMDNGKHARNRGVLYTDDVYIAFSPEQIKNVDNAMPTSNPDIRYSMGNDRYQEMVDEYGAMPKGENPFEDNRNIDVPQQTNDFDKTRGFINTAMEAEQTADETVGVMKDRIASDYQDGSISYEPISNESTLNDANIRINQNGWEEEAKAFSVAVSKGTRITAEDIAVAERCIQEAQKAGNYEAAAGIISDLAIVCTEYGQAIQALSMLKRLSPEGQLKTLIKAENRINNQLMTQGKKPVTGITPAVKAEFMQARSNAKRDEIWNREITRMAHETQGTWADKLNAIRYACMLSNPKTHIRNIIGNFVMQAAYVPRNIVSGALQDIKGGEKTHSLVGTFKNTTGDSRKELREFANYDYHKEAEQVLRNIGNRYDDVSGQFASQQKVFGDSLVGRGLEQVAGKGKYSVGSVLDAEDMAFKQLTYQNALIGYMKANGISVQDALSGVKKPNGASIAKGREYAVEQARKATFTEDNMVADWLSKGERKFGVAGTIAIGSVMPFKKTPLNILSRGVEFSPVGAGMTAYKLYHAFRGKKTKSGKTYDINDVMDSIGANVTGSVLLALGMYMASEGLLVATGDDEEDRKARYDQQMGDQNFAVVNPLTGESWTIDWLAPSAMPLLTGVEVYRQLFGEGAEVDGNTLNKALESASKIADPVFEMSCMQGVASALASYSGDTGDIASSLMSNFATGIGGQYIPQPMAAIARTIDDTVRSSYAPKDSDVILGKTMESFLRQQRSKVPGMSQQNEPSIDVWGNERKREFAGNETEQVIKRAMNNLLNPTTYSTDKRSELDKELEQLYKLTGNTGVLPKTDTNYVEVGGKTYHKTPEEKTAYDTTKGQKAKKYVSDFVKSSAYKSMRNADKAEIISDLHLLAGYEAKKQMLKKRGVWKDEYENAKYENVLKSRTSPAVYYAVDGKLNELNADKDKNGKSISGSRQDKVVAYLNAEKKAGRITDEQWWYFYTKEYSSQAKNAPYAWIREANK